MLADRLWRERTEGKTQQPGLSLLIRLSPVAGTTGALNYLHADHLGSVVAARDASGALVANNQPRYDAYGNERTPSVAGLPTELSFTGQRRDGSGLLYFGARYYDPALGTFISADSIIVRPGDPASLNRYAFAANNPLRYADPTGHDIQDVLHTLNDIGKGAVKQWGYNNAWMLPATQEALKIQDDESDAMLAGRMVGNVASVVEGAVEMAGEAGLVAGGGTFCAATLGAGCIVGGGAVMVAGGAVAVNGAAVAGTALGSTAAMVNNLLKASSADEGSTQEKFPVVYRGGPNLHPNQSEVKFDKQSGLVLSQRGVSVNADPAKVDKFGGAYRIDSLPKGLILRQVGKDSGHFEIIPTEAVSWERYVELLNQITTSSVPGQ